MRIKYQRPSSACTTRSTLDSRSRTVRTSCWMLSSRSLLVMSESSPSDVGLAEVEHLARAGGGELHAQRTVEKDRADVGRVDEVLEVVVGAPSSSILILSSWLTVVSSSFTE